MKASRFWNGRLTGLPCALLYSCIAAHERICDRVHTAMASRNFRRFGAGSVVQRGVTFRNPAQITVGRNVNIGRQVRITAEIANGQMVIGNGVKIARLCDLDISGNLTIGDGVMISQGCLILTHDHGLNPFSSPSPVALIIDTGAWIGARVTILPSVKRIGKNAVIGAGSIVTAEVPDRAIVAGNPARLIYFASVGH